MMMHSSISNTRGQSFGGLRGEGEERRRVLLRLHDDLIFIRLNLHDAFDDQILLIFASILELASGRSVEGLLKY